MKYIILIGDGMAGYPLDSLKGKTTLEAAKTPTMDWLLSHGLTGLVQNVPKGMQPGSDVASMSIFGYDPRKHYPGRAPLEAAAQGVVLKKNEVAFRCNLVTVKNGIMKDFTAGHITTPLAKKLIQKLQAALGSKQTHFYPGVSYRHLTVQTKGPLKAKCTAPHDITGKPIATYLPKGPGSESLRALMEASKAILAKEDTPATQIWLWGQGKAPRLKKLTERFALKGSVITAVDLLRGIGKYAGLKPIIVPGATGFIDTNYAGKVRAGLKALEKEDLLVLHVEAPDECGHMGNAKLKIKAIEDFDTKIVRPIIAGLQKKQEQFRVLILPDHPTPVALKTHSGEPVPFIFYDSKYERAGLHGTYCEKTAKSSGLFLPQGSQLIEKLIHARF